MCPISGLNATFANDIGRKGKVAIISQSGALETAMLDYAFDNYLGFSAAVSVGSMIDVGLGELIEYFGTDEDTESIVMYVESIGDARKFINAARSVALTKPIVLIKVGKTSAGGKAAASHTGSLTGDTEILDSLFKRCGLCQVDSIEELFTTAEFLGKQPRPKGKKLTIITNAGGPGALSVDALASKGGVLSNLSQDTIDKLNKILPQHW
jgi:acetyltransferase